jgi:hypothetical protein
MQYMNVPHAHSTELRFLSFLQALHRLMIEWASVYTIQLTCECWAATPAAAPLGPRNTMGTVS